jgi:serine/threonine-protein kinase
MSAVAPLRIGRYLLFDAIGSGGMASVHLGRLVGAAGFSRTVAVKRLHAHLAREPELVAMLLDEARLAARIRHPNVVPVLDVLDDAGEICLVMEHVAGESLVELVRLQRARAVPVPASIAAAIAAGMLAGLHAAHEARSESGAPLGIVHRDVSPHNVMIADDGLARVLDFGIAYAAERLQVTRDGEIKGKIAYMAPEQLLGRRVDRRSDVYAASVVLWELLAGRRLFAGDNTGHTVKLITDGAGRPPSSFAPAVPPELDRVVMRGLQRDPDKRWAAAAEMASALERAIGLATAQQVADWMRGLAAEALEQRAARVGEIERLSRADADLGSAAAPEPAVSGAAPRAATPPNGEVTETATSAGEEAPVASGSRDGASARKPRAAFVALAACAGLLAAIVPIAVLWSSVSPRGGPAASSEQAAIESAASPARTGYAPGSAVEATASGSAAPLERSSDAQASPKPPASGARVKQQPPPSCSPPYTIDKDGVRVPKRECF